MVLLLNALKSILWILRRNEFDIIKLYNSITPFVQIATGCSNNNVLNFGYWSRKEQVITSPLEAQEELCMLVGKFADFKSAEKVVDVGSGFSGPAVHWKLNYDFLDIICVNINPQQLHAAAKIGVSLTPTTTTKTTTIPAISTSGDDSNRIAGVKLRQPSTNPVMQGDDILSLVNATATTLPFADRCVDRIVALESAQHFKPLEYFFRESKRILKPGGLIVIAIPTIIIDSHSIILKSSLIRQFTKLGLLYFSWASEHYTPENIKSSIALEGLNIEDIQSIGKHVYEPLADYYVQNRKLLKRAARRGLSSYTQGILFEVIENIIYRSALKMKDLSQKGIIDYVLIKAVKI